MAKTITGIDPQVLQIIYLDELCGRIEELTDVISASNVADGPTTRPFQQYQYATIVAGSSGRVFYLRNPDPNSLVGIITQVANSWFPLTYLEWRIDYKLPTQRIEYVMGDVENPTPFKMPFIYEVEWLAYNNAGIDHVFEVSCNGFFIKRDLYSKIVGELSV